MTCTRQRTLLGTVRAVVKVRVKNPSMRGKVEYLLCCVVLLVVWFGKKVCLQWSTCNKDSDPLQVQVLLTSKAAHLDHTSSFSSRCGDTDTDSLINLSAGETRSEGR